jgi:Polyglycine hydrolase-like, structural repeat
MGRQGVVQLNIEERDMGEATVLPRNICISLLALAFTAGLAPANAQSRGKIYDLPLFANDLKPGERYFTRDHAVTTTQKFGYDISGRRISGDSWTSLKKGITSSEHWDDPKNTNYLVYGKPFYAMKAGTIIACWRKAPQNPRPKLPEEDNDVPTAQKGWYHQNLKDGLMSGGGNHLWILHDDGTRALYAHAQTNAIPASLCPKTKTKFDSVPDKSAGNLDENGMYPEIALLPAQRKRVKAGQFLGRIGHSGSSTGPHIHIHTERKNPNGSWVADLMRFRRGMSTPWNGGAADIDAWTSFSGKRITKGNVLFWPPTRLGREYARHKAGTSSFGRVFKHLANSGFRPKLIDGYSVGGRVFLNHIWEPSTGGWRAYSRQTQAAHQANLDKAKADEYEPVFIDSYLQNGQVRYATVYQKNKPGQYRLRSNRTQQQHQAIFNKAKADGHKPVSVSIVSVNGQRRYTALYRTNSIGSWSLKSSVREADYQGVVNTQKAAGRLPIYLNGYMHNGTPYYSVIFSSKYAGKTRARHKLSSAGYQTQIEKAWSDGFVTQSVTAFDGASSQHRYGAVWVKP